MRETEFVPAKEITDGRAGSPVDELPSRGKVERVLNDSTVLTIECEAGRLVRHQEAPVERYKR